ncbi:MAG: hypothetical protein Q4A66_05125 [Eubacteriales bacterium]|nr:hypothetical protein [Eubacteriales bacterium]
MNRNAWRKVFSMVLVLCMLWSFTAQARETADGTTEPALKPQYTIEVDGKNGKITLNNGATELYDKVYVRYSIGYNIETTSFAVVMALRVTWTESQEGIVGTFVTPNVQSSGTFTGASYIVTTNANADELSVAQAAADSLGMLIR